VRDKSLLAMLGLALAAALGIVAAYRMDASPARSEKRVVAILKTATTNAFWSAILEGMDSGAQDFGLTLTVEAPRDETLVREQIGIMERAIEGRPAAIVLAAADYRLLIDPVRKAKRRGIKVVCVDSFIASPDADANVGTDNFEAGRKCGDALLRGLGPGSRVAVMSYVKGSSTAIGRESGLLAALEGRYQPFATSYSASDAATAFGQAKELLAREKARGPGGMLGIAALNLPTLEGAARALDESGMRDRVVLVGVDSSIEIATRIERGVVRDAIVQKPFNMGYLALRAVRALLSGRKAGPMINTGSVDINSGNMFEPENEKLLFPVGSNQDSK
jgi:ribose transport system substrate-binding protein